MNIFRRILNKIFGIPPVPPEPKIEPPKFGGDFPRPVSVTMKATQTVKQDPMAAAVARAKRDAEKTAVKGNVSSASSSSTTRPAYDPLMDPLNPLSPLYVGVTVEEPRHRVQHQDATTISDTTHRHVASHSEPVRSHSSHSSSHSSHDYGSSHSSHSSHNSGSYDHGSSHHSGSDW